MANRFAFRQIDRRDLPLILAHGELRAKNHPDPQACHQTSHAEIVGFRGTQAFQLPFGGVVNDYVPFYFSPVTAFTYVIHQGGVQVKDPQGQVLGASTKDDRIFLVANVLDVAASGVQACYSDFALNSLAPMPNVTSDFSQLESHVNWSLFDEPPRVAHVEELGYMGVCRYFHDVAIPATRQHRKSARMAEFLVKDSLSTSLLSAIIVPEDSLEPWVRALAEEHEFCGRIISAPGCFL